MDECNGSKLYVTRHFHTTGGWENFNLEVNRIILEERESIFLIDHTSCSSSFTQVKQSLLGCKMILHYIEKWKNKIRQLKYISCSIVHFSNSFSLRNPFIFLFQALGVCFNPYRTLCSLYTLLSLSCFTSSTGCVTYTSSSIWPFNYAHFTSIWHIDLSCIFARPSTNLIVSILATGAKTSS